MQIISSTQNLVPLIEELSQNLTAIASMLKADTETAVPASVAETQTETQVKKKESNPKSKSSLQKTEAVESIPAASTGSSEESKPVITIEQVRAILAEKSQAGLTAQVKDLLMGFGSVKLSGIDPARYGELIEAAKALQ